MDCPPTPGEPTFGAELKRGLSPSNLTFGAMAAGVLGGAAGVLAWLGYLPGKPPITGVLTSLAMFAGLTLLHTAAHATMGWVLERGLKAHCQGDYRRAERWLRLSSWKGMNHYDPNGVALATWHDCRRQL